MTTTIIAALKTYIQTYSGIGASGVLMVDFLSGNPGEFCISPQPGEKIITRYVDNSSLRQFPFAFQMMAYSADEATRMANNGFYEGISDWFESQTLAGTLPTLNTNQHPALIEATSQPFLFQQGESGTAVYQMNCRLEYDQDKP
jgi:hypothetical protein